MARMTARAGMPWSGMPFAAALTLVGHVPDLEPVVGSAFSYTLPGENVTTWTITAGALPSGLALNASTGVISGTCTIANLLGGAANTGVFSGIVVRADGPGGSASTNAFAVRVQGVALPTPTAYYQTDNDYADGTGNGHNGAMSGSIVFVASPEDFAWDIPSGSYVEVPDAAALNVLPLAVMVAARTVQVTTPANATFLFGKSAVHPSAVDGFYLGQYDNTQFARLGVHNVGVQGTTVVNDGNYHTWAANVVSNGNCGLFFDGLQEGSVAVGAWSFAATPWRVALSGSGSTFFLAFDGEVDEAAVWNGGTFTDLQHATVQWLRNNAVTVKAWVGF